MGNSATLKQFLVDNFVNLEDYKLHLAAYNGEEQPLDVYRRNNGDWKRWNEYRGNKNDFNRKRIFCLIPDYSSPDTYVFAGIFDVVNRFDDWDVTGRGYEVKISEDLSARFSSMTVKFKRYQGLRGRSFRREGLSGLMHVTE